MSDFFTGWGFTIAALLLIGFVFVYGFLRLRAEVRYVMLLADYLGYDAIADENVKPPTSLGLESIRDEVNSAHAMEDDAWANKIVRGWQMRVQRLEPALAFWVDLLRQIGLLFTVVGLGLSMATTPDAVTDLLKPMGLAVWTTVAGLSLSILLTAAFGMKTAAWTDIGEKNIEVWNRKRRGGKRE